MGFERRVAWLEEDVAVLHKRLRDDCNESSSAGTGAAGDSGLRALVARLDGELAAERRSREVPSNLRPNGSAADLSFGNIDFGGLRWWQDRKLGFSMFWALQGPPGAQECRNHMY